MKYLFYENDGNVNLQYNITPPKELLDKFDYIKIESIKEPEKIEGKKAILKVNLETKDYYYEYIDVKLTKKELKEKQQQSLNAKLLKDNASIEIELNKQKQLNANLLMQIAKVGGNIND